ncbi:MAG: thiamine biosynthesis protein ApbE [Gammaproteobacteria bacterium HGW-Gammaproteobacteria-3]|nr:MAG: thiamine biosynthesis protein ApbE [Gammaproteobacteria bacterium HGW-Gammaproteobacteria-3]
MKLYQYPFNAMGTPCDLQLYARSKAQGLCAAKRVKGDVQRLEARYSRYREDSFLSAMNRAAQTGGAITVDEETASLLDYAVTCYQQSGGLFDITSGLLRKVWRRDLSRLPDNSEIEPLLARIGWHRVHWQPPVLEFTVPGMEIDFGGIVKEYAVDRAAVLCREQGIEHGFVNLGGDIKIIGPRADGSPWRIGIRHPRAARVIRTLSLTQGALASSGDYERCFMIDGNRYGHVLNPKTGWPVRYLAAVSVISDFCVVAGSASTIAMLKEQDGPAWLDDLGLPYFWVDVEGNTGHKLDHSDGVP